jgi:hypothetical protein
VRQVVRLLLELLHGAAADAAGWAAALRLESHRANQSKEQRRDEGVLLAMLQAALRAAAPPLPEPAPALLSALLSAVRCNYFEVRGEAEGAGAGAAVAAAVYPSACFFNHACRPNLARRWAGRRMELLAAAPVAAGEALTVSYCSGVADRAARRRQLRAEYFFDCACESCIRQEGPAHALPEQVAGKFAVTLAAGRGARARTQRVQVVPRRAEVLRLARAKLGLPKKRGLQLHVRCTEGAEWVAAPSGEALPLTAGCTVAVEPGPV